jgi:threonine dehydrogenase-like Zn-dependent dehydrogenase
MLNAGRVIAVDRTPQRPEVAQEHYKPEIVNFGFLDNPQA